MKALCEAVLNGQAFSALDPALIALDIREKLTLARREFEPACGGCFALGEPGRRREIALEMEAHEQDAGRRRAALDPCGDGDRGSLPEKGYAPDQLRGSGWQQAPQPPLERRQWLGYDSAL